VNTTCLGEYIKQGIPTDMCTHFSAACSEWCAASGYHADAKAHRPTALVKALEMPELSIITT
jgi:hypothetical protein